VVRPSATSHVTSEFIGHLPEYRTGELIQITVTARDVFNNLRGSIDDDFTLTVHGQNTGLISGPNSTVTQNDGTYYIEWQFEIVDHYTIDLIYDSQHILGSPVTDIKVVESDVQAYYS
jgi:hypothetical protein